MNAGHIAQVNQALSLALKNHPASELFPMMDAAELKKLADDIRENGLLEPVVIYHDQVLDGRNRLAACNLAEVMPRFVEVNGDIPSPTIYVLSKNLHRRHLTSSQRAMVGARSLPALEEEAKKRQGGSGRFGGSVSIDTEPPSNPSKVGPSANIAAKAVGVGGATVNRAARVLREDPELAQQVERGEISVHAACEKVRTKGKAKTPKPKRAKGAIRADRSAPYSPETPRQIQQAGAQKQKMMLALIAIAGACRGLTQDLDLPMALSVCDQEEKQAWIERARESTKQLRQFAAKLEGKNA